MNSVPNLRVGGSGGQTKRDWRCMACHNWGFITGDQLGSRLRFDVIELGQWQPTSKPGVIRETEKRDGVTLPRRKSLCSCGSGIQYEQCCGKPTTPSDSYRKNFRKIWGQINYNHKNLNWVHLVRAVGGLSSSELLSLH